MRTRKRYAPKGFKGAVVALGILVLALSGCQSGGAQPTGTMAVSPSEASATQIPPSPEPERPEPASTHTLDRVDLERCADSTAKQFLKSDFFEFVKSLEIKIDEPGKTVRFIAALDPKTSEQGALDFAGMLLDRFHTTVIMQDKSFRQPVKGAYYGELFDIYNIDIKLTKSGEDEGPYVDQFIKVGQHTPIVAARTAPSPS